MTFETFDTERFYRRVIDELGRFRPIDQGGTGAAGGLGTNIANTFYTAIPTTVVVAADAPEWIRTAAANAPDGWYLCDGEADHEEMIAAIAAAQNGRCLLSSGSFNVHAGEIVTNVCHVYGMGANNTQIIVDEVGTSTDYVIKVSTDGQLSDLWVRSALGSGYAGRHVQNDYGWVHHVTMSGPADVGLWVAGAQRSMSDLLFWGDYTTACLFQDEGWMALSNVSAIGHKGPFLVLDTSATQVTTISNCIVSPNFADTSPGIVLKGGGVFILSNCAMDLPSNDTNVCILVDGGTVFDCVIADSYFNGGHGIKTVSTFEGFNRAVLSNLIIKPAISGLSFFTDQVVLSNVVVSGGTGDGIHIYRGGSLDEPTLISDLIVDNVDGNGFIFDDVGSFPHGGMSSFGHITVSDIGLHGIILRNLANGSNLHDSIVGVVGGQGSNLYDGIRVEGVCDSVRIHDNQVRSLATTRYGIHVVEGDRTIILHNDLGVEADYGTSPLQDNGAGTILTAPGHATYGDNFVQDAASLLTQVINEQVGVTDEIELGTEEVSESVGVTDSVTRAHTGSQPVSDSATVTSSVSTSRDLARTISESVGAGDVVADLLNP